MKSNKYKDTIDDSEYMTNVHMNLIVSRSIITDVYRETGFSDIRHIYYDPLYPIINKNPITVEKPICICNEVRCNCISILYRNTLDTSYSVSIILYGTKYYCNKYVRIFNNFRQKNIDKFHNILRIKNKRDKAFQLISISHDEMFYGCGDIPEKKALYVEYVDKVFQNIIRIFHRDIGYNVYNWVISMFKTYNLYKNQLLQIEPYFCPTWDMFGSFDNTEESNIKILRSCNNLDYRYYSGDDDRSKNKNYNMNKGFIKHIKSIFYENNILVKDRHIILQIISPDGSWFEEKKPRSYKRYSDIQIGLSVKEKIQSDEKIYQTIARGLEEEIDLKISRSEISSVQHVAKWGNILLFKLDISNLNKLPNNPFNNL